MSDLYAMAGENAARAPGPLALAPPLREVWSIAARGVAGGAILAADGLVFTSDDQWRLVALDAESGQRVWTYAWASPAFAIHDGALIAAAGHDELHLIDLRTGRPRGCLPQRRPEAALMVGANLLARAGTPVGSVTSIDVPSARRRWTYTVGVAKGGFVHAEWPLAASPDTLVIGQDDGQLVAVDLPSGAVRWRRAWPEWGWHSRETFHPVEIGRVRLHQGDVIAEVGGHTVCLSIRNGRPRWEKDGAAGLLYGDRLYTATTEHYLVRGARDGASVRKAPLAAGAPQALASSLHSNVAVGLVSDTHAFLHTSGALVAVERESGKYAWHHQPSGGDHVVGPASVFGRLYYLNGRRLYCLAPVR